VVECEDEDEDKIGISFVELVETENERDGVDEIELLRE